MELRDMRYITAIAKYGTMTKAAEMLHLSQSTLSLACHALEEELGVPLFRKKGRLLHLTDAGEQFCAEAAEILRQVDALRSHMRELAAGEARRFRLYSDAVDISNEAAILYTSVFSDIQVEEVRTHTTGAAEALRDGTAELALTLEDISGDRLRSVLLLEEPMYALLSRRSPLAKKSSVSMTELAGIPVITQPDGYATNTLARSFYKAAGVRPGPFLHVLDPESIVIQTVHRNGVGFIPESTYLFNRDNAVIGTTVALPLHEPYCKRQVYLSYRKDVTMTGAVRYFAEFLRQYGTRAQEKRRLPDENDFTVSGPYQLKAAENGS